MRILLVNDASGVHQYLRRGLRALGHEIVLAMPGKENYQARTPDAYFGVAGSSFSARIRRVIEPAFRLRAMGRFDIANYQLGLTLFGSPMTRYQDLKLLKSSGARLSYYALGCDEASLLRVREDVAMLPCCGNCLEFDAIGRQCNKDRLERRPRAQRYGSLFDFAVSAAYIYDHGLNFFPNAIQARIQFPIDLTDLKFSPAGNKSKPVIIHSPTRAGFKGTKNVLEALRLLALRRSDFEFRVIQGLSHADYILAMQDCDVYIDQIFSGDSFGIAALENMACGKVVVSGNGPLGWGAFPFMRQAPVIRAVTEPRLLADLLSDLLDRKANFGAIAEEGREYVRRHHDPVDVAGRFVALWSGESHLSRSSHAHSVPFSV